VKLLQPLMLPCESSKAKGLGLEWIFQYHSGWMMSSWCKYHV